MEISARPFLPLTPGGTHSPITLPVSDTPAPPLTTEQKEALEKLRDKLKEPASPPVTLNPTRRSLIDEVV